MNSPAAARAWVLAAALILALLSLGWLLGRNMEPAAPPVSADGPAMAVFVGSEECAGCHAGEYAAWQASQHAAAMQHATAASVLGRFDGDQFAYAGVTSRFFRRDGEFFIRTDGPDGQLADFEVKYTFGVEPLQQYLVELPGGRLQAVSVAWDSRPAEQGGQRWFHLYPDEQVDHLDELHWTRRSQNWNFMCADCHSTAVRKAYNAATDAYASDYAEISVGCESCHGPGSAHLGWAAQASDDPAKGLPFALAPAQQLEVCAQCHSRRAQIAEGYQAGRPFTDHYLPSLLDSELYFPDGQQKDEVFIWGSWLQSRMHQAGVTCSDCHDPHSQSLLAAGNAVCAQCHAPAAYDVSTHHHHAPGSTGARCVECHMPARTYMVVDPRRDHSMRVPRPDESVLHGTPNACNHCHVDQDAEWAAAAVRGWLGRDARGSHSFTAMFHQADLGDARAAAGLAGLAGDLDQPSIVRASAIERLARLGEADPQLAREAARSDDPLLRLAAVRLADALPAEERPALLARLLRDARLAVRIEAARSLASSQPGLGTGYAEDWRRAEGEYRASLDYNADRPEAVVALGSLEVALGRFNPALDAFTRARRVDPTYVPAYLNAADALRLQARDEEATRLLAEGIDTVPSSGHLYHSLGLAQVRLGLREEAMLSLGRAMELEPDSPRYTYVYAVALHSEGRPQEAIQLLQSALRRWPGNREMSEALAAYQQR
ncbi:MAG: tetratricopeptide repeat protein [Steroidobacteraceae bacterium]